MNGRGLAAALISLVGFSCEGPQGPPGPMGLPGARGFDGKSATSAPVESAKPPGPYALAGSTAATPYRPLAWISCHATIDLVTASGLGTDGIEETLLVYRATIFTNSDSDSSCGASIGTAQDGSGSGYYPASVEGSTEASCIASSDYPPSNGIVGFWRFAVSPNSSPRAKYVDAGNPLDGKSYVFLESDCSIMVLGQDGEWNEAHFDIFS